MDKNCAPNCEACGLIVAAACLLASASCSTPAGVSVPVPNGGPGVGFDDLRYSPTLGQVLVPSGRTGALVLIDPDSLVVRTIGGFTTTPSYDGSHDFGATSVDEGRGFLFVTDRTSQNVSVVDPNAGAITSSVTLAATPDYVRYVPTTDELWITEPAASQIEVIALSNDVPPQLSPSSTIPVSNGPESLVIDSTMGRAYTHRWQSTSVVLDVRTRQMVAEWPNGCAASRGLALDSAHGFFFAGCLEGTVSVLDARGDGRVLSSLARGAGFDVIGYNPTLGHLYLAGTACSCLVILGVNAAGELDPLGRYDAASSSHCAAADDRSHAWVCDPDDGKLRRIDDAFPASW